MSWSSLDATIHGEVNGRRYLFDCDLLTHSNGEPDLRFSLFSVEGSHNIWCGNFEALVTKLLSTNEPDMILVRAITDKQEAVGGEKV
jgi:hypothetical protein